MIVAGWHDREWEHAAARMEETVGRCARLLAGERSDLDGQHVRSHGSGCGGRSRRRGSASRLTGPR